MEDVRGEITRLLSAWTRGDAEALKGLIPLVETELRRIARRHFENERLDHTLQPTALVNELYLLFSSQQRVSWKNRAHFFGTASQIMRRILVDHARHWRAEKRGGGDKAFILDESRDHQAPLSVDLLALEEALCALEQIAPRQCRVVELRFFGGLSYDEIGEVLGKNPRTAKRDWETARIWLYQYMGA